MHAIAGRHARTGLCLRAYQLSACPPVLCHVPLIGSLRLLRCAQVFPPQKLTKCRKRNASARRHAHRCAIAVCNAPLHTQRTVHCGSLHFAWMNGSRAQQQAGSAMLVCWGAESAGSLVPLCVCPVPSHRCSRTRRTELAIALGRTRQWRRRAISAPMAWGSGCAAHANISSHCQRACFTVISRFRRLSPVRACALAVRVCGLVRICNEPFGAEA